METAFRYEGGKPVGLDWSVHNDGTSNPQVWSNWRPAKPRPVADNTTVEQELESKNKRLSSGTKARIIIMYRDELQSALAIADELGIRSSTVYKVLRIAGVPTRSKSEAMKLSRADDTA